MWPQRPWTFLVAKARALGIDIGATKIALGLVERDGTLRAERTMPTTTEAGFEAAIARMAVAVTDMLDEARWAKSDLAGVGIGCPGPLDRDAGVICNPYTLPGWEDSPLVATVSQAFGVHACLENDADVALLGEAFAGAARGAQNVVMLTIGTGIGGAALVDGRIYRGADGAHPEIGHVLVEPEGPDCYCGAKGCFEAIAAGPAIERAGAVLGLGGSATVFAAAERDPAARAIVERATAAAGSAVWTLLHTFLPELIVFGGGIAEAHHALFAQAAEARIAAATLVPTGATKVAKAGLAERAGVIGAASLILAPR